MAIVRAFKEEYPNDHSKNQRWLIFCPACKCGHPIDDRWKFNGDLKKPTFTPSLLVHAQYICHSFIKDGKIQFLNDCTHELAGQTVDLEEF